ARPVEAEDRGRTVCGRSRGHAGEQRGTPVDGALDPGRARTPADSSGVPHAALRARNDARGDRGEAGIDGDTGQGASAVRPGAAAQGVQAERNGMKSPADGWDRDERDALEPLADQLASIRARHANDPSLDLLRAAHADALPPDLQARVSAHLTD